MNQRHEHSGKYSLTTWVLLWAGLGLFVPLSLLIPSSGGAHYIRFQIMKIMWPSSVRLMATEGIEHTPKGWFFVFISILANVLLYCAIGLVVFSIAHAVLRKKTS
jgi:hypothetical protein